jgi:hypothetical protein
MTSIKVKVLPNFPSSVTATSPILLNKTGGNFAFSLDMAPILASLPPSASIDTTNAANISSGILPAARLPSVVRQKLLANADYYVRRDGSDSNTGLANTAGGAWLTINKALSAICNGIDLAGFTVVVHVQGANVGDGTYTENLLVTAYVGYNGNGFGQFIIQGENGIATITGATASATILAAIGGNASPIQFKNFTVANANASGIIVEADDGGFIALNTITYGSTGAGGILNQSVHQAGRILFMAGTFTMKSGLSTGTGFYARSNGALIFQPGVTINFAGASTFSNAVADIATNSYFDDSGSTWSGTVPTGKSYILDRNSGGLIVDTTLITGSVAATITPIAVGNGGTGSIVSTGSGAVVLANAPTFTGTIAAPAANINGNLQVNYASANFTLSDIGTSFAYFQIIGSNGGTPARMRVGSDSTAGGALFPGSAANAGVVGTTDNNPLQFFTNNTLRATYAAGGGYTDTGAILSSSATGGVGYATGAGGAVTQITSRATGVTLSKVSGAITLFAAVNAAVSLATAVTITVTNTVVAATDTVSICQKSGTDKYHVFVTNVAAGSFQITWYTTGGTTNESPVFNFNVIKGVAA